MGRQDLLASGNKNSNYIFHFLPSNLSAYFWGVKSKLQKNIYSTGTKANSHDTSAFIVFDIRISQSVILHMQGQQNPRALNSKNESTVGLLVSWDKTNGNRGFPQGH